MTSSEIRKSYLNFFGARGHSIVPSSSLLPDSPNLLFTNAGMNQFVPIFLGQRVPDVSKWAGASPGRDTRAVDTQKCIRAGGKHNDLDDVGLDTYHHTFFEMLGNWSFGDYFKAEAIQWAWDLVVGEWGFPPERLYATVYAPAAGDPSSFDQEAWDIWAALYAAAGLDPRVHIVNGNRKDNFWMMGETGPCGPCSEFHVDLTPAGDTRGSLVNAGDPRCIEIWNLVFIQYNANADGSFEPLPAKHVDTGMGFERVASIIQGTNGFRDFQNARISNYETDIFRPIFDELEALCGRRYGSTLPRPGSPGDTEQERTDVAFRVIADHIRTLTFSIADGIQPGNTDRNYVLRRILRRAVRYGRQIGFHQPFFYKLSEVLLHSMGDVFPELRRQHDHVREVLHMEEEAFNRTLDRGIALFEGEVNRLTELPKAGDAMNGTGISGEFAFRLYDEQGFPIDLTELMARERGLSVDTDEFDRLMEQQRAKARAAQKKEIISLANFDAKVATIFEGFTASEVEANVLDVVAIKDRTAVVLDASVCYAEMGGQVSDRGMIAHGATTWEVVDVKKVGETFLHFIQNEDAPQVGSRVNVILDCERRWAVERHHTVTHLLHWAIHEVVGRSASQKGSYVGPDKLTFDFNSAALTSVQVRDIERLVNERILDNAPVTWIEVPHADVAGRADIMQFFGDKYGEIVRVVQIGGELNALNGYSMELCGGTHVRATGQIGAFRILSEAAIASGVRRIEAIAGLVAHDQARRDADRLQNLAGMVNAPVAELEKKLEISLGQIKTLEKQVSALRQKQAAAAAVGLLEGVRETGYLAPALIAEVPDASGDELQAMADALKGRFAGVVFLAGVTGDQLAFVATVGNEHTKDIQAGKLIQTVAPLAGGKGGGRPDSARGGGKDPSKLPDVLDKVHELLRKE